MWWVTQGVWHLRESMVVLQMWFWEPKANLFLLYVLHATFVCYFWLSLTEPHYLISITFFRGCLFDNKSLSVFCFLHIPYSLFPYHKYMQVTTFFCACVQMIIYKVFLYFIIWSVSGALLLRWENVSVRISGISQHLLFTHSWENRLAWQLKASLIIWPLTSHWPSIKC